MKVHKKVRLENVSLYLAKVLHGPGMDLIKAELTEFLKWLKDKNQYQIRGASLLFVLDDDSDIYRVKLIDLGSFKHTGCPDEGLITGVTNLI